MAHNWADWDQTKRSYELIARHVFPRFQQSNDNRDASIEWARDEPSHLHRRRPAGHRRPPGPAHPGKGTENVSPEILEVMGLGKQPAGRGVTAMDNSFTPEHDAFRAEVRDWIEATSPRRSAPSRRAASR
jgi:hypothetical protein